MPNPTPKPRAIKSVLVEWTRLLKALKKDIGDDCRAEICDDPDDETPGMQVTFGVTINEDGSLSWSYQTGDNSYTGGAYGHPIWAVVSLYRRSRSREVAEEAMEDALSQACC